MSEEGAVDQQQAPVSAADTTSAAVDQQQAPVSAAAAAAAAPSPEVTGSAKPAGNSKELISEPDLDDLLARVSKKLNSTTTNSGDAGAAGTNVEKPTPTPKQIAEAEKAVEEAQQALDASPQDEGLKTALKTAQDNLADLKSKTGGRRRTKRKHHKKGKSAKKGGKKHRKSSGNKSRRSSSKKSRRHGRK